MIDIHEHARFKDAPWYMEIQKGSIGEIIVGGAGGIGSWVTFLLARMGLLPIVFDPDTIEHHNMGGQFFKSKQIGANKTEALLSNVFDYTGVHINSEPNYYDEDSWVAAVSFSCFDNMKARRDMFELWVMSENPNGIFIDGRLLMEQMNIFCIRAGDQQAIAEYRREHLFDDDQVEDEVCTLKQTTHTAMMIASHMIGFFTNHMANLHENSLDRSVPFEWSYFVPLDFVTSTTLTLKLGNHG